MLLAIRKVGTRALVVALGEFLLAACLVPSGGRGAAEAGYPLFAAFLALPAALVTLLEIHLVLSGPRGRPSLLVAALTFLVALAGVLVAHLQAAYVLAIAETGSMPDGMKRALDRIDELFVADTSHAFEVLGVFFVAIALAFTACSMLARDRHRLWLSPIALTVGVAIASALLQEAGRLYWNDRVLEHAAIVVALSTPVLFALADELVARAKLHQDGDEQNAR